MHNSDFFLNYRSNDVLLPDTNRLSKEVFVHLNIPPRIPIYLKKYVQKKIQVLGREFSIMKQKADAVESVIVQQ